jgi:PAS domain S-box-containing protein
MTNRDPSSLTQSILLRYLHAGVMVLDPDGQIMLVNEAAGRFLGGSETELVGHFITESRWSFLGEDEQPLPTHCHPIRHVLHDHTAVRDIVIGVEHIPSAERRWALASVVPELADDATLQCIIVTFIDITAHRQAEAEHQRLSMQRQLALDAAQLGWWHYHPVTKIASFDQRYTEIFGVSGHERPNEEILQRIHPDDLPGVWEKVEEALNPHDPKPYTAEYRINFPDGTMRWIEAHGQATFNGTGTARHAASFVGTVQDITARKQATWRQQHLTDVLRAIRNVNQLITQEKNREALLRRTCELLTETRGYSVAWIGLRNQEGSLITAGTSGLDADIELVRAHIERGDGQASSPGGHVMSRAIHHGNRDFGILAVVLPAHMAEDLEEQLLFQEVVDDVAFALSAIASDDRHHEAVEALRASEEQFRTLVSHAPDAIFVQTGGTFAYLNNAALALFGATEADQLLGKSVIDFFHPDHRAGVAERIRRLNQQREPVPPVEECIVRLDGKPIFAELTAVPFTYLHQSGALVFGRDITERKNAIKEQERLQNMLNQAQKMESVGRLAGGVAHDFNNMLGVILGHADLALEETTDHHPLHHSILEIQKAANRSANLTRQLLAFARKQTVEPRVLNLNETIESMLAMLRRLIGEDLDLAWLPGCTQGTVLMDPSQLDQILANLVVNARDAIQGNGRVTIETQPAVIDQVYCELHPGFIAGKYIMLAVSDNGCGMNAEVRERLFEPFFTTKEMGKGTGLGLATVYGIVRQNNGFIHVYSEPDNGSTFRIYLPQHNAEPGLAPTRTPDARNATGQEVVLIVEDEPSLLKLTTRMLEKLGYTVLKASKPEEAMAIADQPGIIIHLLMTDVVMPNMNGRTLSLHIARQHPGMRILFMSGYTANVIAHHGVLDEGVHFIQKPFSTNDLADKVRIALES